MTAKELIRELKEALVWCSGAEDFQEGGKARSGWLQVRKLIDTEPEEMDKIKNPEMVKTMEKIAKMQSTMQAHKEAIECLEIGIKNLVVQKRVSPKRYHDDIQEEISSLQSTIKHLKNVRLVRKEGQNDSSKNGKA